MKRIYFGFALLLLAACAKQDVAEKENSEQLSAGKTSTISLDDAIRMANGNRSNGVKLVNSAVQTADAANEETFNINLSTFSGTLCQEISNGQYEIIPVQGYSYLSMSGPDYLLAGDAVYKPSEDRVSGSTYAIRFPFKKGSTYTISTVIGYQAYEVVGDVVESVKRFPKFKAQLTNDLGTLTPCSYTSPVDFSGPSPIQTFPEIPPSGGGFTAQKNVSISFTPSECYDYIWFKVLPNTTGKSEGNASIFSSLKIVKKNEINIVETVPISPNEVGTFAVEYNGFPIGSNFTWSVTGDLEIIGSNVGQTVQIKSLGLNGGQIKIGLDGCDDLVTKTIGAGHGGNVKIIGSNLIQTPSGIVQYQIKLSGSLINKVISSVNWTIPDSWESRSIGEGTVLKVLVPATGQTGVIKAVVTIEGYPPLTVERTIQVQYRGSHPPDPPHVD